MTTADATLARDEQLLDEIAAFVRRYLVMSDAEASVIALFVVHTHAIGAFDMTPYLSITSAEKRSGKSRLLEILDLLCARSWRVIQPTEAVVYRKIQRDMPTLLLDEVDAIFGPSAMRDTEGLRALLNAGFQRGTTVPRCVGPTQQLVDFATFCPKVLAGIGDLPDTVADRALPIRLKRKAPGESCERFRAKEVAPTAEALHTRCHQWAEPHVERLRDARPGLPHELDDRGQDVVEPLLAIADLRGGDWPQRARRAVVELRRSYGSDDASLGIKLLADIRAAFLGKSDRLRTEELLEALRAADDAPWADLRGQPLSARKLAWLLRPYAVEPCQIRFDDQTAKGYYRAKFEDAWSRYLPETQQGETAETSAAADPERT